MRGRDEGHETMVDNKAKVNLDKCIGCGICTIKCPTETITLIKKEEEQLPPKSSFHTYKVIAEEREKLKE